MIKIIHNKHDQLSKNMVKMHGHLYEVIDWLDEKQRKEYLDSGFEHPSFVPSLLDTETKKCAPLSINLDIALSDLENKKKDVPSYVSRRYELYIMNGVTEKALITAWVQKEVDGDRSEWDRLMDIRDQVKISIPKTEHKKKLDDVKNK